MTARRFHDIGISGWFMLLLLLPYISWLIVLVLLLIPSRKQENGWGPVPDGAAVRQP